MSRARAAILWTTALALAPCALLVWSTQQSRGGAAILAAAFAVGYVLATSAGLLFALRRAEPSTRFNPKTKQRIWMALWTAQLVYIVACAVYFLHFR
jgi:amino acid transporter